MYMYLVTDQRRSVPRLEAGGHTVGHDDHKTLGENTSEVLLIFFSYRFIPCSDGKEGDSVG